MTKNQNAAFVYLYRDAGNYKEWGQVIFENPEHVVLNVLEQRLRRAMMTDSSFIASQVGLPEVFLFNTWAINEDDHCLHEFESLRAVEDAPNDDLSRSILEFVQQVEEAAVQGWLGFHPTEHRNSNRRFRFFL